MSDASSWAVRASGDGRTLLPVHTNTVVFAHVHMAAPVTYDGYVYRYDSDGALYRHAFSDAAVYEMACWSIARLRPWIAELDDGENASLVKRFLCNAPTMAAYVLPVNVLSAMALEPVCRAAKRVRGAHKLAEALQSVYDLLLSIELS